VHAGLTGLPLTEEDIQHLHVGYVGIACTDGAHSPARWTGRGAAAYLPPDE